MWSNRPPKENARRKDRLNSTLLRGPIARLATQARSDSGAR